MKKNAAFKPFLKWAGSKSRLIEKLEPYFPSYREYNSYHEPFLGSGAVFFYLKNRDNKPSFISDVNSDLINCFYVIKHNPNRLINQLTDYANKHNQQLYLATRDKFNNVFDLNAAYEEDLIERAVMFIYLNKTCFNGLYRVNSKGEFNVPIGSYSNPKIADKEVITNCSNLLQRQVIITQGSYKGVILSNYIKTNDFVYLDPPYDPISNTSNFTAYTSNNFSTFDQVEVCRMFKYLDEKNVKVMLSNSDSDFIKYLYKEYNINEIETRRTIAADKNKRIQVKELVITNY
jgi:DNA adenine methylase